MATKLPYVVPSTQWVKWSALEKITDKYKNFEHESIMQFKRIKRKRVVKTAD